jgi:hypothetical protein
MKLITTKVSKPDALLHYQEQLRQALEDAELANLDLTPKQERAKLLAIAMRQVELDVADQRRIWGDEPDQDLLLTLYGPTPPTPPPLNGMRLSGRPT